MKGQRKTKCEKTIEMKGERKKKLKEMKGERKKKLKEMKGDRKKKLKEMKGERNFFAESFFSVRWGIVSLSVTKDFCLTSSFFHLWGNKSCQV